MADASRLLILSSPPFVREGDSVARVMWRVNLALLPALAWGVWSFGPDALRVTAACAAACVLTEAAIQRLRGKPVTVADGSAVVTGILLALNLPPGIPTWMTVVGSVVAIAVAKQAFGGSASNIFNPALIGRAFLMASYPAPMTSWRPYGAWDAVTTATPLGIAKEKLSAALPSYAEMLFGKTGGCIGETSTLLLLAGALYLLWRGDITWHVPASFLASLALVSRLSGRDPLFSLLAGGRAGRLLHGHRHGDRAALGEGEADLRRGVRLHRRHDTRLGRLSGGGLLRHPPHERVHAGDRPVHAAPPFRREAEGARDEGGGSARLSGSCQPRAKDASVN